MNTSQAMPTSDLEIKVPDPSHLYQLTGIKWSRYGPKVIPAWVADMDIQPPELIFEAVMEPVRNGDFGYNRHATASLAEAFAAWQQTNHGWAPDPDQVVVLCDVLQGVDLALSLHTEPGDGVVLFTPIYPPFVKSLADAGCRMVGVPLDGPGWRVDPDRLEAAIDPGVKAILMANPHNPTGRTFSQAELEAVAEVAARHNLLVISDEVWGDLVHPEGQHIPFASLGDHAEALALTLTSTSKSFNTAGLRCAVAHVGHPGLSQQIGGLAGHILGAVSTPGGRASTAAWTKGGPWLNQLRTYLTARRDQLASRLGAELPGVGFQLPEATYLAWLDFRELDMGDDPAAVILDQGGLALSPGPDFSDGGPGNARLNFATSEAILNEIIDRLVGVAGRFGA